MYLCGRNRFGLYCVIWAIVVVLSGCGREQKACVESDCPGSEVCVESICVAGEADLDQDGLTNALEMEWGLSPISADTDRDGMPDGEEWGEGKTPADADDDGEIDALESLLADGDGDCIPDQLDAHDGQPDALDAVKQFVCPSRGVCDKHYEEIEVVCADGLPVCAVGAVAAYEPDEYSCDGLDNDCDGSTDEGITLGKAHLGETCVAPGVCGVGTVECNLPAGIAVCSSGPGGSADRSGTEICDLKDNDCDGFTDEEMNWEGLFLGEVCDGFGECGEGVVQCCPDNGQALCSTMPGGLDDEAEEELCDGLDNNCDDQTDEGLESPDLSVCSVQGVCAEHRNKLKVVCNVGTWVCDPSGIGSYTKGVDGYCDNLDNNCDGLTDEDYHIVDADGKSKELQEACGTGPCAGGKVVCTGDLTGAVCSTWTNRTGEVCDALDNNCDGVTDENQEYGDLALGDACKGAGICGVGAVECSPATLLATCSTNPDGSEPEAQLELCDLLDNDCDGETDEDIETVPVCFEPGVCEDSKTFAECQEGEWTCDFSFIDEWEADELSCDDLDNDCDGDVDEDLPKEFSKAQVEVSAGYPPARHGAAWSYAPDKNGVFLSSGLSHPFPWAGEDECLADIWFYDFAERAWTELPSGPLEERMDHSVTYDPSDESLVILGGRCGDQVIESAWCYYVGKDFENVVLEPVVAKRYGHAAFLAYDSGAILVVGGKNDEGFADSYLVGSDLKTFEELPEAPLLAFAGACEHPVANMGYMFGGLNEDGTISAMFHAVDLVTGDITEVDSDYAPGPREHASLACAHDSVFLFGGVGPDGALLADAWVFDVGTGQWSHASPGPEARMEGLVGFHMEKIHLVGGLGEDGKALHDDWTLDGSDWSDESVPHPGNLAGAAFALDKKGDRAFLMGGFESGGWQPHPATALWSLEMKDGKWVKLSEGLGEPVIFASLTHDPNSKRLLLAGGASFPAGEEPQPLVPQCRFMAYGLETEAWSEFSSCGPGEVEGPGPLASHAAALRWKDATLWLYGGIGSDGMSNELWKYELGSGDWEMVETAPPLPELYGHAVWIREEQGDLLVVGGVNGDGLSYLVDLNTAQVTVLEKLNVEVGFPTLLYDQTSDVGLVLRSDMSSGTQFFMDNDDVTSAEDLVFSVPPNPTSASVGFFDSSLRVGFRFGGVDSAGLTRGDLLRLHMDCK